jgi:hypothetical protein
MNAIEQMKSVLCDPDGKCCIAGSDEDRAIIDRALQALAAPVQEPVAKLQVTLQDRPIDIELAQYKRMFESACSALGAIGDALGCDPEEGGAEPILDAIAELKTTPPAAQRQWVGLTMEDIKIEIDESGLEPHEYGQETIQLIYAIEAKLKEKNNG